MSSGPSRPPEPPLSDLHPPHSLTRSPLYPAHSTVPTHCFDPCVENFSRKYLDDKEKRCIQNCVHRFTTAMDRVGTRFGTLKPGAPHVKCPPMHMPASARCCARAAWSHPCCGDCSRKLPASRATAPGAPASRRQAPSLTPDEFAHTARLPFSSVPSPCVVFPFVLQLRRTPTPTAPSTARPPSKCAPRLTAAAAVVESGAGQRGGGP
jgi:hypothetical protein